VIAAASIAAAAIQRLLVPRPLEQVGLGLAVTAVAALVNLVVAMMLLRTGRKANSITLEANAHHLLTDVWTSAGVIAGVGAVVITGWVWLDPVIALLVAVNIVRTGIGIVHRSILGLMDAALPPDQRSLIDRALEPYRQQGVAFHAMRTRQSGARRFVSTHVLVPGDWTVQKGHELLDRIEADIRAVIPDATVFTHLESLDDPASWEDVSLDRRPPSRRT
jgi:cation diffusion facilitator family transporter